MKTKRAFVGILAALALLLGSRALTIAPAFAGGTGGTVHCNSGNGNGQELIGGVECDPGNSAGHNNGGG